MNKAKFWLIQITMLAIVSLAFGPTAIAAPKSKAVKTATSSTIDELATHGEEMRLDKANLEEGNADWKTEDTTPPNPDPVCSQANPSECTVETCGPAGGIWGNDRICYFFG